MKPRDIDLASFCLAFICCNWAAQTEQWVWAILFAVLGAGAGTLYLRHGDKL